MKTTEYPQELAAITEAYTTIMQSEVFRLDGPAIDLPEALATLANLVSDYPGDSDDWIYLDGGGEASIDSLIAGAYWALTEWHGGQSSPEYAAMCALGIIFNPGYASPPTEEDGGGDWAAYEMVTQWFSEKHPARG